MKLILLLSMCIGFNVYSKEYKISDHYDGKRFFNPKNHQLKSFIDVIEWKLKTTPEDWPSHVRNKEYSLPKLIDSKAVITFINHATYLLQLNNLTVLTDPIFSERSSPVSFVGPKRVREPGVAMELLPKIDVVIISHNHYDHLDLESIKNLDAKFKPLFIVPLGDEELLLKNNIQNVKEVDWWEEVKVKNSIITFAPAQHWSSRGPFDSCKSLWGSYMISGQGLKIYFAGDTGTGDHFLDIRNRLGSPDASLLPIGAYEPNWFMKPFHINPEQAVKAHLDLVSGLSFAMHFGTFQLSDEGIDRPVKELKEALIKHKLSEDKFRVLDQGESYIIP